MLRLVVRRYETSEYRQIPSTQSSEACERSIMEPEKVRRQSSKGTLI